MVLPITVLVWHAYNQLKWESFHRYRTYAEELSLRIDRNLVDLIELEQQRPAKEFNYFNQQSGVLSTPKNTELRRSPLSVYSPEGEPAGILGYFQVDEQGYFSSPLVPSVTLDSSLGAEERINRLAGLAGLPVGELKDRFSDAAKVFRVLLDNQLVDKEHTGVLGSKGWFSGQNESRNALAGQSTGADVASTTKPTSTVSALQSNRLNDSDGVSGDEPAPVEEITTGSKLDSQSGFDRLVGALKNKSSATTSDSRKRTVAESEESIQRRDQNSVSQLNLDSSYEQKSELYEKQQRKTLEKPSSPKSTEIVEQESADDTDQTEEQKEKPKDQPNRRNTTSLSADGVRSQGTTITDEADSLSETAVVPPGTRAELTDGFKRDVGPYEFSRLDSGPFIMFRELWNGEQRLVQGMVLDPSVFLTEQFEAPFNTSLIADNTRMLVAFDDEVLADYTMRSSRYASYVLPIEGNALYRRQLTNPFGLIQLVYTISELPSGPGARVLAAVTLALLSVLCGGFYLLYRTGLKQIGLAKQQQNFVSSISHELKTPLTSIRMYSEMLKSGWTSEEKKQDYYQYILEESERLTRLINNVLRLSSIDDSNLNLEVRRVAVDSLIDVIKSKLAAQLEHGETAIVFDIAPDVHGAAVKVDEDAFVQVIINLLDNALKFSKNGARKQIDISAQLSGRDEVRFAVRDYGPGIPRNHLKKIFDLFYRAESELTRETVGTGIGLAIVDQLTRVMGGRVDVVNVEPGAEFRVYLKRSDHR